ncbi:MAG: hypothetical protein ACE3JK_13070 [Sporolactobacillus sp.]
MNFQPYAVNQSQLIGTFAPEQILRGKVLDILPDRTALLQMGTQQVVAKVGVIDPPLKTGQEYLFQIQQQSNPLLAKVVTRRNAAEGEPSSTMVDDILNAFHLKDEPVTRELIHSFLDHGDPLTRDSINAAGALIKGGGNHSEDIQALHWMMQRELPLSPNIFQIAKLLNQTDRPITDRLNHLLQSLNRLPETSATVSLKAAISNLLSTMGKPADFAQAPPLFQIMKQLGLDLEGTWKRQWIEQGDLKPTGTLKEALMAVTDNQAIPTHLRAEAEQIVQQLTGQQLQMLNPDTMAAQFTLQIPLPYQKQLQNLTVYWEGKKDRKGTIDPAFCTLLLCLDLSHLSRTLISVRVQKREVSLRVQNSTADLRPYLKAKEKELAKQLEALDYHLNSVLQTDGIDPFLIKKAAEPLTARNNHLDVKA